jgi:hypothetical protein
MRFSIRDLMWMALVVALCFALRMEHKKVQDLQDLATRLAEKLAIANKEISDLRN